LFLVLGFVLGGCTTTSEKIYRAMNRVAWAPRESEVWNKGFNSMKDLDRMALRGLLKALDDGWYKGQDFREYGDEIDLIRYAIIRAVGELGYEPAADKVADFVASDKKRDVRLAAIRALGHLGYQSKTIEKLTPILTSEDEADDEVKIEAATSLCKLNREEGAFYLMESLGSDDPGIVENVERGLIGSDYYSAIYISEALKDERFRDVRPRLEKLIPVLTDSLIAKLDSEDREVRLRSAKALGYLGDRRAIKPLLALLEGDKEAKVRLWAAISLGKMGDPEGISYLFSFLGSEDNLSRKMAVDALVEVGELVVPKLIDSLKDENHLVRCSAAQALGIGRFPGAVPALVAALQDTSAEVRWNAAVALGMIGDSSASEALKAAASDTSQTVAFYANWSLERLGEKSIRR